MDCLEAVVTLAGMLDDPPLCPKCPHEVREHQPVRLGRHANEYVACQQCDCIMTMLAKLKAWGGPRK